MSLQKSDAAIAENIVAITYEDLPPHVVEVTKQSLLDSLGVIIAATTLGEGCSAFSELAREMGGTKQSTVIQGGFKVPAAMAAFANGSLSHSLDFENVHDEVIGHPDVASIPAALAAAEMLGNVSGKELITALAVASDLYCRMSGAITERSTAWFDVAVIGAYSSAAAVAKLLKLNPQQTLDAVSLAFAQSTCSWELLETRRSNVRAVREGFSAKAGVMGALLAKKGVMGFDHPFEGNMGFFQLYAHGKYSPERFIKDLGKTFEGAAVSFKPYPACRGTHAFVDAAIELAEKHDLKPSDIESMKAVGPAFFEFLNKTIEPGTAMDAKFSHRYTVATAIHKRELRLVSFSAEAIHNPSVIALGKRLSYEVDNSIDLDKSSCGGLEITLKNGTVLWRPVKTASGHPDNPLNQDQLIRKFRDCASYSQRKFSDSQLERLMADILSIEKMADTGQLMAHFSHE